MKKKSIKNLQLNKKSIATFEESIKAGKDTLETPSTIAFPTLTCLIACYTLQDESWCWE
ncbi:MAG: hypothetical protein AAF611_00200 [Bacteroidota bacterium]